MRSVSAIILINLACVYGLNTFSPTKDIDRFTHLLNNGDINPSDSPNVTYKHIQLHLDHFNSSEKRTLRVWYVENLDFWQPNGPIYIWPHRGTFVQYKPVIGSNDAFIFAMAKETQGAMFLLQERYFPPSLPKIPKSKADKYYNYLSTTQQLADIAEFIKYLKSKPEYQSSKVVLMGHREGGNHATWMRLVYPNLVDAVVAISAPLLAKKDAKELYEFVANLYEKYGHKDCIKQIEEKLQEFPNALKNKTALEIYKKKHNICPRNNFTVIEDQQLYMQSQYFSYMVIPILGHLQKIKDCKSKNEYTSIKRKPFCYNWQYDNLVFSMKSMKMAYYYQGCTEYGQADTTSAEKRPFVHYLPLSFSLEFCKDVWGIDEKRMDEGIAQTNLMYGGLTPNVTNVVFTQGELNPYTFLGVQQNLSDSAPAFVVKEDGDYNIMYYDKNEPTDRTEVRNRVKTLIKKWIGL